MKHMSGFWTYLVGNAINDGIVFPYMGKGYRNQKPSGCAYRRYVLIFNNPNIVVAHAHAVSLRF